MAAHVSTRHMYSGSCSRVWKRTFNKDLSETIIYKYDICALRTL